MALKIRKPAAATAAAAAFCLLATPVSAVDLPRPAAAKAYDGEALDTERNRRWRRGNDIDAGDVIAGVVVLGAIAAIAGAANNRRERYERYPAPYPREDARYRTPDNGYDSGRGIDRAVDMCVIEVERGRERVATVDTATRSSDGWRVSGELDNGSAYSCTIGNDGRISDVNLGAYGYGSAPGEPVSDEQWDDEFYYRAREAQSAPPPLPEPYDEGYESAEAGGY